MYRVYRNLNNGLISIKDKKTNRVIGYAEEVWINNPKFIVSEAGRQRVLKEKRKNVHAFIEGEIIRLRVFVSRKGGVVQDSHLFEPLELSTGLLSTGMPVHYNPYRYHHFYFHNSYDGFEMRESIHSAELAYVNKDGEIKVW